MPSRHKLFFLVISFICLGSMAWAQRDLGTVSGTITDPTGAAVPNAKVSIINEATGIVNNSQSNDSGAFTIPALNPGSYSATIEAAGFQKAQQKASWLLLASRWHNDRVTSRECESDGRSDRGCSAFADGIACDWRELEFTTGESSATRRSAHVYLPGALVPGCCSS